MFEGALEACVAPLRFPYMTRSYAVQKVTAVCAKRETSGKREKVGMSLLFGTRLGTLAKLSDGEHLKVAYQEKLQHLSMYLMFTLYTFSLTSMTICYFSSKPTI